MPMHDPPRTLRAPSRHCQQHAALRMVRWHACAARPAPTADASQLVAALLGSSTPTLLNASGETYTGVAAASGIVYLSAGGCFHHMKVSGSRVTTACCAA